MLNQFFSIFGILAIPLFWGSSAYAGQLFINYYGFSSVIQSSGVVMLGTVVAVNASKSKITLMVKKVWHLGSTPAKIPLFEVRKDSEGKEITYMSELSVEVSKKIELDVYQGVKWENEDKSPMDDRLYGAVRIEEVKVGEEIIFAKEPVKATADVTDRLDRIVSKNFKTDYPKKASDLQLVADLEDYDLSKLALKELIQRKKASFYTLVAIKDETLAAGLIGELVGALNAKEKISIFDDVKKSLSEKGSVDKRRSMLRLFMYKMEPDLNLNLIENAAKLISHFLVHVAQENDTEEVRSFKEDLIRMGQSLLDKAKPQPGKAVTYTSADIGKLFWVLNAEHFKNKNPEGQLKEKANQYSKNFNPDGLIQFTVAGFKHFDDSIVLNNEDLSFFQNESLSVLHELVIENSKAIFVDSILTLPVSKLSKPSDVENTVRVMIQMAVALAKNDSKVISLLKPTIEKHLASKISTKSTGVNTRSKNDTIEFEVSTTVESSLNFKEFDDYKKLFRNLK